ncbi:unnamed protein product [Prunus brigantina]
MSDLIRSRRAVTTTLSSEPPTQPASAATAPALMEHDDVLVGPGGSQEYPRAVSAAEDGEGHPGDQQSYQHRIGRAPSGCTDGGTVILKTTLINFQTTQGRLKNRRGLLPSSYLVEVCHDIGHVVRTHCPM